MSATWHCASTGFRPTSISSTPGTHPRHPPRGRAQVPLFACRFLLALVLLTSFKPLYAIDDQGISVLALRVQKTFDERNQVDFYLTARFDEGFREEERKTAELRYTGRKGGNDFSAAWNLQFDRRQQSGQEHRLWQQLRHQFAFEASTVESWIRLEERYFTNTDKAGGRLRVQNRWSRPLQGSNVLRLGHEWVFNLNDLSRSTQRGTAQNRLIGILQHNHPLPGGTRLELQYQFSYLAIPAQDPRALHQLQLMYVYNL